MKTQVKSINHVAEEKNVAVAGTPGQQEMKYPHASNVVAKQPSISYLSMMKEVEKIADPASFKEIKEFYNMG